MEMREVRPGSFFGVITRPRGAADAFPFHAVFEGMDVVESQAWQVGRHRHDHFEFICVEKGAYRCLVNGESVEIPKGALVMLKPGDHHEDRCVGPTKFHSLHLRLLPGPKPDRSARVFVDGASAADQVILDRTGVFAHIRERVLQAGEARDAFTGGLLDALAFEFIWQTLSAVPRRLIEPRLLAGIERQAFALDLNRLFGEHLHHHLGLRQIAKELGMSERTLSARCRAELGASPTRLFVRHQMERARMLLAQADLPIAEISAYLGFSDPYHFSKVYKRVHGVAPTKHR